LDRGLVFGDLPPAVIRNRSDDFQQLDRSIRSRDRWHIEIEPQSDRLLENHALENIASLNVIQRMIFRMCAN
jgi:hypothetical protein